MAFTGLRRLGTLLTPPSQTGTSNDGAGFMLGTTSSLPLAWLLTLGFEPTRFQMKPPACYRATSQLPKRQITYADNLPFLWTHEKSKVDIIRTELTNN